MRQFFGDIGNPVVLVGYLAEIRLRLSKRTEYGLRAVAQLATALAGQLHPVQEDLAQRKTLQPNISNPFPGLRARGISRKAKSAAVGATG